MLTKQQEGKVKVETGGREVEAEVWDCSNRVYHSQKGVWVWERLCLKSASCMPKDGWMLFLCGISKWLHSAALCEQCQVSRMKCLIIIKNENKVSEFTPPLAESAHLRYCLFLSVFLLAVVFLLWSIRKHESGHGQQCKVLSTSGRPQSHELSGPWASRCINTDPWLGSSGNHLLKLLRTWWRICFFNNMSEISSPTANDD